MNASPSRPLPQAASSLRIVVADDDRDTVTTLTAVLQDEGHDVRGVLTGAEVLELAYEFDPDVVVLDIHMPDLNGYEVARSLRARYGERRPQLIAISGVYKKAPDRMLAHLAGFDHHLSKPYETAELTNLLKREQAPYAEDTYRVALVRAAEIVGGAARLAHRLQVPISDLTRWLAGFDKPSIGTFLRVVDLLIQDSRNAGPPAANDQRHEPSKDN